MTDPKISHSSLAIARLHSIVSLPLLLASIIWCGISSQSQVIAQTEKIPGLKTATCPVDLNLLKSNFQPDTIVTADSVSAAAITLPSFWWTSEQFPAKLVTNWIADANAKEVFLLVNPQYWNILDYVDRYRLVNRFGRVARDYGYNLQLCTPQKVTLANYTCNLQDPQASCQIWFNDLNREGLSVNVNN